MTASEDILVIPLEEDIDIRQNVFNGEVIQAENGMETEMEVQLDNDMEAEMEVQDGTDVLTGREPTRSEKKRTRKPNNENCNEEPPTKKRKLKPSAWKANQTKVAHKLRPSSY